MVAPQSYYRTSLETELKRYPRIRAEDITVIQQWLSSQPHLPAVYDVQIAHFLHACYYDVEVAKNTIENYFTYKSFMTEFFTDWDPMSRTLSDYVSRVVYAAFLPKKSPTDCQIILLKLNDPTLDLYNFNLSVKWLLMSVSRLLLEEGQQTEFKIVYDAIGFTMSHIMRNPLSSVRHYLDFGQKASAIRVVEIHFINSSSVVKKLITIVKPFMNKHVMKMCNHCRALSQVTLEGSPDSRPDDVALQTAENAAFANKLSFHTSADAFFKTLSTEQIPSDYGGTAPSIEILHGENIQRVKNMQEALIMHNKQKSIEEKRLSKKKKVPMQEFRKLEID